MEDILQAIQLRMKMEMTYDECRNLIKTIGGAFSLDNAATKLRTGVGGAIMLVDSFEKEKLIPYFVAMGIRSDDLNCTLLQYKERMELEKMTLIDLSNGIANAFYGKLKVIDNNQLLLFLKFNPNALYLVSDKHLYNGVELAKVVEVLFSIGVPTQIIMNSISIDGETLDQLHKKGKISLVA